MPASVWNVDAEEGSTVTIRVRVQESDGTAADLTSYTGAVQVRPDALSEEVYATGTVTFGDNGLVQAQIPASETTDWTAGYYDVRIVSPTNEVEYPVRGRITLRPTVTAGS